MSRFEDIGNRGLGRKNDCAKRRLYSADTERKATLPELRPVLSPCLSILKDHIHPCINSVLTIILYHYPYKPNSFPPTPQI
jgi:hypothetical protein